MAKRPERRPRGFGAFDALTRKLIQVPKDEVDQLEAKRKKRRRKK